jgi:hypothetical protein
MVEARKHLLKAENALNLKRDAEGQHHLEVVQMHLSAIAVSLPLPHLKTETIYPCGANWGPLGQVKI